ncbi:hypothetical protein C3B51_17900 [Pseudoalteromonas rubra]|uniref:Uncharacterized protein n=1 Tax=Pseudoalteromonas rubra TaxID=43658 RepID=A0A4Q7E207_9GAMM|nr:hypothetical protein [Pseudoalteromonas rubra]RZM76439.1 hypothetical protein C3B51_17900 [Pseudoalteromonas rubra]
MEKNQIRECFYPVLFIEGSVLITCLTVFIIALVKVIFGNDMFELIKDITSILGGLASLFATILAWKAYSQWVDKLKKTNSITLEQNIYLEIFSTVKTMEPSVKRYISNTRSLIDTYRNLDERSPKYESLLKIFEDNHLYYLKSLEAATQSLDKCSHTLDFIGLKQLDSDIKELLEKTKSLTEISIYEEENKVIANSDIFDSDLIKNKYTESDISILIEQIKKG